jgi:ATP-dependent RNA helicase RhlE
MTFDSFSFSAPIRAGIEKAGFKNPTPIQAQSIPVALEGTDVLGLAQTGTGKTAAFVLPILERLSKRRDHRGVRALILAPTRELVDQIHAAIAVLGAQTSSRSMVLYGGVGMRGQVEKLQRGGVDIVVACPGRLLDHLTQKTISLQRVEVLVLDEADQMFDMGFLPTVRRILKQVPTERQTLFFSATMPQEIRRLSMDILRDPTTVQIDNTQPAATITHEVFEVTTNEKGTLLRELLQADDVESVLVFTRTKHRAKSLAAKLMTEGFKATSLQGNLSQVKRQKALEGFRDGTFKVMVATDIAARGIDVSRVSHVINFDLPATAEVYTHRIGRTGRALKSGVAFSFVAPEERSTLRIIERGLSTRLPRRPYTLSEKPRASDMGSFELPRPPQQPRRRIRDVASPMRDDRTPRERTHGRPARPQNARQDQPRRDNQSRRHDSSRSFSPSFGSESPRPRSAGNVTTVNSDRWNRQSERRSDGPRRDRPVARASGAGRRS